MVEKEFLGYKDYPINLYIWDVVAEPKGVVQIVHGMVEHAKRYNDFANFLNANGYIVIADDHRGHGVTAKGKLGVVPTADNFNDTLEDEIKISKYALEQYKLPVTLFGHSYGSFLSQAYIERASNLINGVILSGSARQPGFLVGAGNMVASMHNALFGKDKPAKMIDKLAFGGYNKKFKNDGSPYAWLSKNKDNVQAYEDDKYCGYLVSIGFYKAFFGGLTQLYKKDRLDAIRKDLPIFIISGDMDPVGGFGKYVENLRNTYVKQGIKSVDMKLYHDLRHEILNEVEKREIYDDSLAFIDSLDREYKAKL